MILLICIIIGGVLGLLFPQYVFIVRPLGEVFLNLIFCLVVPLVLCSISTAVIRLQSGNMMGRVLMRILAVFSGMALICSVLAWLGVVIYSPIAEGQAGEILAFAQDSVQDAPFTDNLAQSVSAPDFLLLFSKSRLLPLIVFAMLLAAGTIAAGEKGKPLAALLESGMEVTMKMVGIVMKAAPLGLGCYFACTIAELGGSLIGAYLRSVILYIALSAILYLLVYPLLVLIGGGRSFLKAYFSHLLPPSLTAFAAASSAAAMPGSIEAACRMGADRNIAESVIPFGVNLHKDGSILSGVIKAVFLLMLMGRFDPASASFGAMLSTGALVCGMSLVATLVMGAVPGGAMTGELLICSMLGLDPSLAGVIIVIGTLVDMPASLLNSTGNLVAALLVDRWTLKSSDSN